MDIQFRLERSLQPLEDDLFLDTETCLLDAFRDAVLQVLRKLPRLFVEAYVVEILDQQPVCFELFQVEARNEFRSEGGKPEVALVLWVYLFNDARNLFLHHFDKVLCVSVQIVVFKYFNQLFIVPDVQIRHDHVLPVVRRGFFIDFALRLFNDTRDGCEQELVEFSRFPFLFVFFKILGQCVGVFDVEIGDDFLQPCERDFSLDMGVLHFNERQKILIQKIFKFRRIVGHFVLSQIHGQLVVFFDAEVGEAFGKQACEFEFALVEPHGDGSGGYLFRAVEFLDNVLWLLRVQIDLPQNFVRCAMPDDENVISDGGFFQLLFGIALHFLRIHSQRFVEGFQILEIDFQAGQQGAPFGAARVMDFAFDAGVRSVDEIVDETACDAVRDGIVLRAVRDVQLAENRASFVDDQLQKRRVLHVESADGERPPVADFRLFNQDGRDVAMVSGRPDARVFETHPVPFRIVRLMFR